MDLDRQQRYSELLERRIAQLEAIVDAGSKTVPDVNTDKDKDIIASSKPHDEESGIDKSNPTDSNGVSQGGKETSQPLESAVCSVEIFKVSCLPDDW